MTAIPGRRSFPIELPPTMVIHLLLCLLSALPASSLQATKDISIDSLHIRSDIRHRFSQTLVTSRISNRADFPQDVTFDIRLPEKAFISAFSMLIDGAVYPGRVEEKAAAERRFEQAVQQGQSAGKIATSSARESNDFDVTVNVAAQSSVTFNLTYEELLERRMGLYEHVIHVNPGEVIPDLRIQVVINESREITKLTVPELRGDKLSSQVISQNNRFSQIRSNSPNSLEITFAPTPDQQRQFTARGVSGQFIVNYDVDHTVTPEGEILVSKGYFVHFFAPENLPPMGKRIVFVLDTSGSMSGRKIEQLREALVFILGELRPVDEFGILLFSTGVNMWGSGGLIPATSENVQRAQTFARTIKASGGTNIHDALLTGLRVLSHHKTRPSMILFLTDGQATVGETSSDVILRKVRAARHSRQSIYSLAFGNGADFGLLQKLSSQNQGFARKIFVDADAALQLAGFYNEISSPLLSEVLLLYISDLVDKASLTKSLFGTIFSGSEVVVAGRYDASSVTAADRIRVMVEGSLTNSSVNYITDVPLPSSSTPGTTILSQSSSFIERLWVYLTIKQLVRKTLEADDPFSQDAQKAKAEALRLSLKYQFVTPYTAMVVTKPPAGEVTTPRAVIYITQPSGATPSVPIARTSLAAGILTKRGSAHTNTQRPLATFAFRTTTTRPNFRTTRIPATVHRTSRRRWATRHFATTTVTTRRPGTTRRTPATTTRRYSSTTTPRVNKIDLPSGFNFRVPIKAGELRFEALCLDLVPVAPADPARILLLEDEHSGLLVTGTLHSGLYEGQRKLQSVSVRLNGSEVLTVSLTSVSIRGRSHPWWRLSSLSEAGVTATGGQRVELTTPGNVNLVFHKYGIETRRSLSSPFIALTVGNTENLDEGYTGLISSVVRRRYLSLNGALGFVKDGSIKLASGRADKTVGGTDCFRVTDPSSLADMTGPLLSWP